MVAVPESLRALGFLLHTQEKFAVQILFILLHIASLDTTHYKSVVSLLLSPPQSQQQIQQLSTTQRLAVFTSGSYNYQLAREHAYMDELKNGIRLSDDQYFRHCKEVIEAGELKAFGILSILNMVNPATIDLLIQSLKLVRQYHRSEGFKYILHINSQQWREIVTEQKQQLLSALEELKRSRPGGKKGWNTDSDYNLMEQSIIKLSFLVGKPPLGNDQDDKDNNNN